MNIAKQGGALLQNRPVKRTRLQKEAMIGWLFLSPWIIGFVLLKALPILAALIFSLTDFKMLTPEATKFVGLENYQRFLGDNIAGANLFGSLGYFLLTVPLEMVVALVLAAIFTSEASIRPPCWVARCHSIWPHSNIRSSSSRTMMILPCARPLWRI